MALAPEERRIVELIRKAPRVTVILNTEGVERLKLTVGGRAPHDIALAVQTHFNELNK